jgi:hypothetical protein
LDVQDMLKSIKVMEKCLETVHEITKLIKQSPICDSIFKNIKHDVSNDGPGIRLLCPTRWTVRAESRTPVSENFITLQKTWDATREATKDTDVRAKISGVAAQMEKFEFFYGLELERKTRWMIYRDHCKRTICVHRMDTNLYK